MLHSRILPLLEPILIAGAGVAGFLIVWLRGAS